MDEAKVKARIDELLGLRTAGRGDDNTLATELYQGAITMLALTHGEKCSQISALRDLVVAHQKSKEGTFQITRAISSSAVGSLKSLKSEVDSGLVGNLRREVTGEVLGDLLLLAKTTLDQATERSKNVAAVLVAAAFEDTLRRLGGTYCGIYERASLPAILDELKKAEVLKGSQIGVVQSHFQFRNDAMHADWEKIDVVGVKTVMELVQQLLLKHFS